MYFLCQYVKQNRKSLENIMSFFENKKIVVTGGTGFVGSHYIEALSKLGSKIRTHTHIRPMQTSVENIEIFNNIDLTKLEDCMELIEGADIVIHVGGSIAHPSTVPTDIHIALQNINALGNILDACNKHNVKKYLDFNSSTGYPDRRHPVVEDEYWEGEPYKAYFGYGWKSRYKEKMIEHVSRFSNTEMMIARGAAIFGPYDNFDTKTCHVVPALINRVLTGENPFTAWGSPDVVRDFLYIEDAIKATLLVLEKGLPMRPYNVGSGKAITIGEILDSILKATDLNPEVVWDNSKPTTIPFRMVSTQRINDELGFTPEFTFDQGIKKTVDWYIKNYLGKKDV
jgi:GDP-L-fucose synthase